jgi:ADP-ribosylation factor 1/2
VRRHSACVLSALRSQLVAVGFNVETLNFRNLEMTIWDVGGQDKVLARPPITVPSRTARTPSMATYSHVPLQIRQLWKYYYENTDALIFLVDSADPQRIGEAREELHRTLADDGLRDAVVLVLANKQDLKQSMRPDRVAEAMGLSSLRHKWYLQPCSATSGDGLYDGLEWLGSAIRSQGKEKVRPVWSAAAGWSAAAA